MVIHNLSIHDDINRARAIDLNPRRVRRIGGRAIVILLLLESTRKKNFIFVSGQLGRVLYVAMWRDSLVLLLTEATHLE